MLDAILDTKDRITEYFAVHEGLIYMLVFATLSISVGVGVNALGAHTQAMLECAHGVQAVCAR